MTIQQIGVSHGGLFERQDDLASVAYWYQTEPHRPFEALMERKRALAEIIERKRNSSAG